MTHLINLVAVAVVAVIAKRICLILLSPYDVVLERGREREGGQRKEKQQNFLGAFCGEEKMILESL